MEFQIGDRVSYRNTLTRRFPKDPCGWPIYPIGEVIGITRTGRYKVKWRRGKETTTIEDSWELKPAYE
ncbi:MAG: hypothetical protein NW237_03545 [Cyanobacteriota bacterium]|nr:hypothetical protein [Cyanobacteriota bacterium]